MDVIIRCRSVQKSYASYMLQILDKTETFQVSIKMQSMSHQRGISTTSWITRCIPLTFSMVCGAQSTHHEKFVADPIPSHITFWAVSTSEVAVCVGYHGVTKLGPGLTQRIMTCIEFIILSNEFSLITCNKYEAVLCPLKASIGKIDGSVSKPCTPGEHQNSW